MSGRLEERTGVQRDLRAAHRRVVVAGGAGRRRIERNLRDGALFATPDRSLLARGQDHAHPSPPP